MTPEQPPYYNDLLLSLEQVRFQLETGAADRKSAAHTPAVATLDHIGRPHQRVMILRHVDWLARRLSFHTDVRSPKVTQISASPSASVLIYDAQAKAQIRLEGEAEVNSGDVADLPWSRSTPFARRCYMAETDPGSPSDHPTSGLPGWIEGVQPDESQLVPARANFSVLHFTFDQIEWLYLANAGHRRARYRFIEGGWHGEWLVP